MTPRLEIRLDREPGEAAWADLLRRVPAFHRAWLVAAWADAAGDPPAGMLERARDAGFVRVRWAVPAGPPSPGAIDRAVAAGANELELDAAGAPWTRVRHHRQAGALAFVRLRAAPGRPPPGNPCDADELQIDGAGAEAGAVDAMLAAPGDAFSRVSVRGLPLCTLPGLDPARVLSNALAAAPEGDGPGLLLPFDEPARAYFGPCGACALALACDGTAADRLAAIDRTLRIRAFPDGPALDVPPGPRAVALRRHPAGFLNGKVHVLAVLAGIRPCGRLALPADGVARALNLLSRLGLRTAVVGAGQVPGDLDTARDPAGGVTHVFFSRDGSASRAADLERRFAAAEASGAPMGTAPFSRALGRILGYPACCIDAFVAAGPEAATDDLVRAAHGRSRRFHWALNHLDARSTFPLIAHIPCRYDCEASVEQALRVHGALDSLFPFLGAAARRVLARPVLFVDGARIVAFGGAVGAHRGGLAFGSVDPLGLRDAGGGDPGAGWKEVLAVLASARHLGVRDDGLRLSLPDGTCEDLPVGSAPRLFPFGTNPEEG